MAQMYGIKINSSGNWFLETIGKNVKERRNQRKNVLQNSTLDDKTIWYEHAQGLADDRWPKQGLQWMSPGRKKTGIQKGRNHDAVAERGVEEGQWIDRKMAIGNRNTSVTLTNRYINTHTHINTYIFKLLYIHVVMITWFHFMFRCSVTRKFQRFTLTGWNCSCVCW